MENTNDMEEMIEMNKAVTNALVKGLEDYQKRESMKHYAKLAGLVAIGAVIGAAGAFLYTSNCNDSSDSNDSESLDIIDLNVDDDDYE